MTIVLILVTFPRREEGGTRHILKGVAPEPYWGRRLQWYPTGDEVRFVVASTYRTAVLKQLMSGPATPSSIAADAEIALSHVSRALAELREHELVELLVTEDRKKGRVYDLTDHGTDVWETIETQELI